MPLGVIVNSLSIAVGGIIGAFAGNKLTDDFKEKINMIFGCCSMAMGISSIVLMENMPAVVFSVIIGTIIGLCIHLGELINKAGGLMQKAVSRFLSGGSGISEEEFTRAKRGDFIGKSEMLQIQSPGNETQEIHMPPQAIKGKDNANDRRRRRGSGLKGSRTERMVEQLAEFKAWLRDNPVNERIAARTVGARASTYWRLHEKTFAKDATRTGEKRGFSSPKTLASAYRNSKA